MYSGFVTLLRLLWPFVKESVLQDGTMRDWLRRNRSMCLILIFQVIMLCVCFYLAEMVTLERLNGAKISHSLEMSQMANASLVEHNAQFKADREEEREANQRMRVFIMQRCQKGLQDPCQFLMDETVRRSDYTAPLPGEPTAATMWCAAVQQSDLKDDRIRQRYVRECPTNNPKAPEDASKSLQ